MIHTTKTVREHMNFIFWVGIEYTVLHLNVSFVFMMQKS